MLWWLGAAGATFYLIFRLTARPRVRALPPPPPAAPKPRGPSLPTPLMGTRQETPEAFAGEVGRAVYDPSKNPFWRQEKRQEKKEPPPAPKANSSGFPGSFDDIMPDEASEDDYSIERAAEEAAEEVGDEELE